VAHNLTDLLDVKTLDGPRLLVIHCTLGGTVVKQPATPPAELRRVMSQYIQMIAAHVMVVSRLKGRSWDLTKTWCCSNSSSPVQHGVNGFLADDPMELRAYAWQLLHDANLAGRMGMEARKTVSEQFSLEKFLSGFAESVKAAQRKWNTAPLSAAKV
jgi:hypothetical protein